MYSISKPFRALAIAILLATPAMVPVSSGATQTSRTDQAALAQVAGSLEKALPALVSSGDYRSASNMAFLLATARSRLDQADAACAALSDSLEYYRQAVSKDAGEKWSAKGTALYENTDGMALVRAKFGCNRPHSA